MTNESKSALPSDTTHVNQFEPFMNHTGFHRQDLGWRLLEGLFHHWSCFVHFWFGFLCEQKHLVFPLKIAKSFSCPHVHTHFYTGRRSCWGLLRQQQVLWAVCWASFLERGMMPNNVQKHARKAANGKQLIYVSRDIKAVSNLEGKKKHIKSLEPSLRKWRTKSLMGEIPYCKI